MRLTAALMAMAPSSGAVSDYSEPRNFPIGVRAAATMTGIRDLSDMVENAPVRPRAKRRGRQESYSGGFADTTTGIHRTPSRLVSGRRDVHL